MTSKSKQVSVAVDDDVDMLLTLYDKFEVLLDKLFFKVKEISKKLRSERFPETKEEAFIEWCRYRQDRINNADHTRLEDDDILPEKKCLEAISKE
mmetsp:Transcript_28177/g.24967  ORF Transcript_28177/g.24967 Transcript_28177/m.24967 type:complete len:95 (+) Transcript_28177:99-383(+)